VRLKAAEALTASLKPNQLQSVRQPLLSQEKPASGSQPVAWVGSANSSTSYAGALSGSGGLTKVGSGTFTLSGANTHTGTTTISAGAINIQNALALGGTAGSSTVSSGAALQLQGGIAVGSEALSLSGSGVSNGGALRNISGNNSYGGNVTLATASRINSDANLLTVAGNVTATNLGLAVGGAGWIGVIATLNGAVQSFLPTWVRTRGLSIYQMVLFGSTAAGSALAGAVAGWTGSVTACLGAGVVVVLVGLSQLALPLAATGHMARGRGTLPLPPLETDDDIDENAQTLVLVRYRVDDEHRADFLSRMALVEHSRRRTVARSWTLYADREQPGVLVEAFDVGSWREHLSQHAERLTGYDEQVIHDAQILAMSVDTEHLIATGAAPLAPRV
jgi:autotransporter-associated beta strand protein